MIYMHLKRKDGWEKIELMPTFLEKKRELFIAEIRQTIPCWIEESIIPENPEEIVRKIRFKFKTFNIFAGLIVCTYNEV